MFRARTAPAPKPYLEVRFGVAGMAAGRKISMWPWMGFFASDPPVRDQIILGLHFAALNLIIPGLAGIAVLGWLSSGISGIGN